MPQILFFVRGFLNSPQAAATCRADGASARPTCCEASARGARKRAASARSRREAFVQFFTQPP